jgi:hypothetical protein
MFKFIELVFTVLGGLGGLILVINFLRSLLFKEAASKKQIEKLVPATNINFFNEILGSPTFVNKRNKTKQYVFIKDLFYVDAITDFENKVLAYSVTTRDKNFNPSFTLGPYSTDKKQVVIKLGKSTFSEVDDLWKHDAKITSGLGNRRMCYREEHYFGNPGLYQTYIFGMNDAGYIDSGDPSILNMGITKTSDPRVEEFRKTAVINTYTIIAPFVNPDELEITTWLGPDLDQVRIINR